MSNLYDLIVLMFSRVDRFLQVLKKEFEFCNAKGNIFKHVFSQSVYLNRQIVFQS